MSSLLGVVTARCALVDPNANDWDLEWTYPDSSDPSFFYMSSPVIEVRMIDMCVAERCV